MKKRDYILISIYIVIALAGIAFLFIRKEDGMAYVYVSGNLYGQYDLNDDAEFCITGANNIINDICIDNGSIYVKEATCPYKECVRCGRISRKGESIICLPARIMIVIKADKEDGYDAITK